MAVANSWLIEDTIYLVQVLLRRLFIVVVKVTDIWLLLSTQSTHCFRPWIQLKYNIIALIKVKITPNFL